MKKTFFLLLSFASIVGFSQEFVKSFPLDLKKNRDYFQIVNDSAKEVTLFISDKKRVKAIWLDENMKIIDSLSTTRPDKKYVDIIGYNKKKSNYRLYWATKNKKEMYTELYDFSKKKVTYNEIKLSLTNEEILQKITINGVFYIITTVKDSDLLKFYKYGETGVVEEKTIDVAALKFLDINNKKTTLYELLNENVYEDTDFELQAITNQSVSSLVSNSKRRKLYVSDTNLILSLDNNPSFTQTLTINLADFSFFNSVIVQPYIENTIDEIPVSNSYIFDSKIIQIKLNRVELAVSIKTLDGTELKSYTAKRDAEIEFKNSDIIQENGSYDSYRILEKSNQFIRKVNNSKPSITCDLVDGNYYVTIGGVSDITRGGGGFGVGVGMGGGMGTSMFFSYSGNYTFQNLISYKEKKVVFINCLFDTNFNHRNGELKKLAFEKVRQFVDNNDEITGTSIFSTNQTLYKDVTLFKFKNSLFVGNYNNDKKEYKMYRFVD